MIAPIEARVAAILREVRAGYNPPPRLTVSEFADRELVVTSGPLAGTHWSTDWAPYQREIMDAFHEPGVEIVVVMGSAQWGKTSIALNLVAYHMVHDPCPILVVEPTVDPMAREFAKNRLDPLIAASPALRAVVSKKRSKDSANTMLAKAFRGGSIAIGGANSAASLAARTIRVLILDEIDRYPAELTGEGATIQVAIKRTAAYKRRRRILLLSSPTIAGSPISTWFARGDARRYAVPCKACGEPFVWTWACVQWTDNDPATARLHCPACDYGHDDGERAALLGRGAWIATAPGRPNRRIVSFHMWEIYSPICALADLVTGFLEARDKQKHGDPAEMHTWQNTTLGEPRDLDAGEGVEAHALLARREAPDAEIDCPAACGLLTLGVDTQDDRLEALVVGWGVGETTWIVDRITLPGDPSDPEPWQQLDALLEYGYLHASGHRLPISATAIDSAGHRTSFVYDYVAKKQKRNVLAIIGRAGPGLIISSPSPRRWGRQQREVPLYTIGVDAAKAIILSRLDLVDPSARGYVHLPLEPWCDEELAQQLTSEYLKKTWHKGIPSLVWTKKRTANHALDMFCYALAALRWLNPDLAWHVAHLAPGGAPAPDVPPAAPRPRAGWLGPPRAGWLRR